MNLENVANPDFFEVVGAIVVTGDGGNCFLSFALLNLTVSSIPSASSSDCSGRAGLGAMIVSRLDESLRGVRGGTSKFLIVSDERTSSTLMMLGRGFPPAAPRRNVSVEGGEDGRRGEDGTEYRRKSSVDDEGVLDHSFFELSAQLCDGWCIFDGVF